MNEYKTRVAELSQADTALEDLLQTLLAEVPDYEPEPEPAVTVQAETVCEETAALNVSAPAPIQETAPPPPVTARPGWAQGQLKVLVVRIGELRLAVPLLRLSAILPAGDPETATRLPAQPEWHRGVMQARGESLVRVDPVALLGLGAASDDAAYLLVLDSGRFALEIEGMEQPLSVDADEIRWRRSGEGRDWALGVLPGQMCVLLDLDVIDARLAET